MTDLVIPAGIVPNEVEFTLADFSGVFVSPTSGATRTVSRGQRWNCALRYYNLIGDARRQMAAFVAACRGHSNRVWLYDKSSPCLGSFPDDEILVNSTWANGTTGWTAGGNFVLSARSGRARARRTSVGAGAMLSQAIAGTNGLPYAFRGILKASPAGDETGVMAYMNNGGAAGTAFGAGGGLAINAGLANGTAGVGFYNNRGAEAGGQFYDIAFASFQRCGLIDASGGSPSGSSAKLKNLPASTNGLALAGDMVSIMGELKRLVQDLDSDSGGGGYLLFEPALRSVSLPDATPVIFGQPLGRFVLDGDVHQVSRPGTFSDFELTFIEA